LSLNRNYLAPRPKPQSGTAQLTSLMKVFLMTPTISLNLCRRHSPRFQE